MIISYITILFSVSWMEMRIFALSFEREGISLIARRHISDREKAHL